MSKPLRICDGEDPELIMYRDLDGRPTSDPEFGVISEPCSCGMLFDEKYHDLVWPHFYTGGPMVDLKNLGEYL